MGWPAFVVAPPLLAAILLWRFPRYRRFRLRSLGIYVLVVGAMIYGALRLVAGVATAVVPPSEVLVVLWFTAGWRLA